MLWQVNYKYVLDRKIRPGSHVMDAKTEKEARALAIPELKALHDHFEITRVKSFTTSQ